MAERARRRIDLNADVGEGYDDAPLFPFLSSVNVACGAHAGDEATMRSTIEQAAGAGLAIGAHPSFPDRARFGRTITTRDCDAIIEIIRGQTSTLAAIADALGVTLTHVKPHGALYNLAASDPSVADAVAQGVLRTDPALAVVGLSGSHSIEAARRVGLTAVTEAFVDRGYRDDGSLAPRDAPGAVLEDPTAAATRAVAFANRRGVETVFGGTIRVAAQTLCLHADTRGALSIGAHVHAALTADGVDVRPALSSGGYRPKST